METQNIFDNEEFFKGYRALRENPLNYNLLLEKPAMERILPDLCGKRVLDLGCGFGEDCARFVRRGAKRVVGVDISEKMLEIARREHSGENILYLSMDLCDLAGLDETFDVVYSSLTFHYVKALKKLLQEIHARLSPGGLLLFSQEHPLTTAPTAGPQWEHLPDGERLFYRLNDYGREGVRRTTWFVEDVVKYHRTVSTVVNDVLSAGFSIEHMEEPTPGEEALSALPKLCHELDKPSFLLLLARRS